VAVPKDVVWKRDPHTEAKHQILASYLDAYFPIMAKHWASTGICFVDAFAGPGEYSDGSLGSPILALHRANRSDVLATSAVIHLVYVEKDPKRYAHLVEMLAAETVPSPFRVSTNKGPCEDVLLPELDRLCVWGGPVFANFDGFGVDTPHQLVERVGKAKAPEVLVTFQAQWFTRFANQEEVEAGDRVFGDQLWRAVADISTPAEKKRFLVDEYRSRLTKWGFPLHLTFELVDEKGHELLLVFGTGNSRGMEKMKDAMWRVDPVTGSRFRDPRDPNQMQLDLSEADPNLSLLGQQILRELESGPKSMEDLQNFALLETVYKKVHAKEAVDVLEADRKVQCDRAKAFSNFIVRLAPPSLFDNQH
jgi:three-Cys-motif partner protein